MAAALRDAVLCVLPFVALACSAGGNSETLVRRAPADEEVAAAGGAGGESGADDPEPPPEPPGVVTHDGPLRFGESWGRAWGGNGRCQTLKVAVASDGTAHVSGWFERTVDFDPGEGVDERSVEEGTAIFLSRYSPEGEYLSTLTWSTQPGSTSNVVENMSATLALSEAGDIYLAGRFSGSVDFDPGPAHDVRQAPDPTRGDGFVTKLAPSDDYRWTVTLGGTGSQRRAFGDVAPTGDAVYATAQYTGEPAPSLGLPPATPGPEGFGATADCGLVALDLEGNPLWAASWGNLDAEYSCDVAADAEHVVVASYATARFALTPSGLYDELDPGSVYGPTAVLYDPTGTRRWVRVWGSSGSPTDLVEAIALRGSAIYVGGTLSGGDGDFGLPSAPDIHSLRGLYDGYLFSLDMDGNARWVGTWGGAGARARTLGVATDDDRVVAVGSFAGAVDFGPGAAYDTDSRRAPFVTAFDHDGNHLWARIAQGTGHNVARSVALHDGSAFVSGIFWDDIDLAFGDAPADVWSSPSLYACFVARFPAKGADAESAEESTR